MGQGPVVLLLHGGSLGSSADVSFAATCRRSRPAGFRAIAYDQPGFRPLRSTPSDHSNAYRRESQHPEVHGCAEASTGRLSSATWQSRSAAMQTALQAPQRVTHVIVLGTGSLLPPADDGKGKAEAAVQQQLERRMAQSEPTIEDTRKLLEANLFHHELITPDKLELRHSRSVGAAFEAFCAQRPARSAPRGGALDPALEAARRTETAPASRLRQAGSPRPSSAPRRSRRPTRSSTCTSWMAASTWCPGTRRRNGCGSPSLSCGADPQPARAAS